MAESVAGLESLHNVGARSSILAAMVSRQPSAPSTIAPSLVAPSWTIQCLLWDFRPRCSDRHPTRHPTISTWSYLKADRGSEITAAYASPLNRSGSDRQRAELPREVWSSRCASSTVFTALPGRKWVWSLVHKRRLGGKAIFFSFPSITKDGVRECLNFISYQLNSFAFTKTTQSPFIIAFPSSSPSLITVVSSRP